MIQYNTIRYGTSKNVNVKYSSFTNTCVTDSALNVAEHLLFPVLLAVQTKR